MHHVIQRTISFAHGKTTAKSFVFYTHVVGLSIHFQYQAISTEKASVILNILLFKRLNNINKVIENMACGLQVLSLKICNLHQVDIYEFLFLVIEDI